MRICEIYQSIQGETYLAGNPTTIIRTAGCNMNCTYCDTKYASTKIKNYKLLSIEEIIKKVLILKKIYSPTFVSITGGEPLLQNNLEQLFQELKKLNLKLYLETNATFPKKLKKVVKYLDVVCINFKLKNELIKNFVKTVKIVKKYGAEFFIKIVITDEKYDYNFINKIAKILKKNQSDILILQPESKKYKLRDKKLFDNLSLWYQKLSPIFKSVQIIPQMHKFVWKTK
jgi:7-carboxy-7-deazaguanine synthase